MSTKYQSFIKLTFVNASKYIEGDHENNFPG